MGAAEVQMFSMMLMLACGTTETPEEPAPTPTPEPVVEEPVVEEAPPADADNSAAVAKFNATCAPCHGETGLGDGAAAAALDPKPASFAEATFWAERDDAHIMKVIKEGGASVGKSPLMAPFANSFENDAEIEAIIAHMKSLQTG